ncbi:hypothetical protein CSA80_02705 [Candidatus Saccharibacteria bacterium]|nr:MAG: hypothetical protein CR973_02820 [Candidatus Saccharibacteria bacterium]PID99004.1 MAG: hypothetical protein CSA80_02705 [Candidatus Saccharibacteria bacterium]
MTLRRKSPNILQRAVSRLDKTQQKHRWIAFPYALIKKCGDDRTDYQAALIAYYGFLSLFPTLIVATAIIQIVAQNNPALQEQLQKSITSYFPAIGQNLSDSIRTPSKSGLALAGALLISLYGAQGVARAIIHSLNRVWCVPRYKHHSFPKTLLRSYALLFASGIGLIAAAALTGYATSGNIHFAVRAVLWLSGFSMLFIVFWGVYSFGPAVRKRPFANIPGSLVAAVAFTLLHALGSYIITRQLRGQTGLNAQFAVVLALLFWLYLQAQVFLYALQLNVVRAFQLYPRSIVHDPPTPADRKALTLYQKREAFLP